MRRLAHDPWRGMHAVVQHSFTSSPPHSAYVPLTAGQQVTILSPPFWVWLDHGLLTGTYMVAVTTYCPATSPHNLTDQPPPPSDHNNDYLPPNAFSTAPSTALPILARPVQAPMAYLGVAPLSAFMP